ncbi:MAG: glycogen/starch/alpha-glucan phosphorylase [Candidatus Omnitrophica bacterium]|nr:glycogen/starch/alpha-glucan phosphorylase [Candidatus Omnitrophota bacterium]
MTNHHWDIVHKEMGKDAIKLSFKDNCQLTLAKDKFTATRYDNFLSLSLAIRDRIVERWIKTQQRYHNEKVKRVYYLSMEFLIGRLLGNNILNLGLWREVKGALQDMGLDLEEIREQEVDAGLGNGGLGRLAACFLDSMATLGIPAHGYGIRYEYGIFHQKIVKGNQVELPDEWLKHSNPWEIPRPEYTVRVRFYGRLHSYRNKQGLSVVKWKDAEEVLAIPYDTPIPGYKNDVVNTLRLWSAKSTEEFDLDYFNHGDYERAVYNKMFSENISKVLYPNDMVSQGRELRLKQEYFFTAASIADIIRRFKIDHADIRKLPERAAIQINDTHPSLGILELMRILIDEESLEWEEAWDIVVRTFGYTNHTVMPEALETWPEPLFRNLLPRHMKLVEEINFRFLKKIEKKFPGDLDRLRRMSLIEEGNPKKIRMAYLAIIGSHSINGVSQLHTSLLKSEVFKDFFTLFPERFNCKTNGITPRRWLQKANLRLATLITDAIGYKWSTNLGELERLLPLKDDPAFRERWRDVKLKNKRFLSKYIRKTMKVSVSPESLFDVQVKRIHEYKRQTLFGLYIISQYLKVKNSPGDFHIPRTFILGGKAAPGYFMAKLIIKFLCNVARVINQDKGVREKIRMVFVENYRVSLAEKIFPASDLSEQISTAGREASGTGCMKFMMNGALTIGTFDGANIEMAEAVGRENIFMFGLNAEEIQDLKMEGYYPRDYINNSPVLKEILNLVQKNFFSPQEPGIFSPLLDNLLNADPFFVCADFDAYCAAQNTIAQLHKNDPDEWIRKSIINVAKSGRFSSDRTVEEYARDIWNVPIVRP